MRKLFLLTIVLIISAFTIVPAQEYPNPVGYANDFAGVMDEGQVRTLDTILIAYEKRSSIEIAVVTIDTLNGQSIEEYTVELATRWGVGKKEKDNGIVILNSIGDRQWRIEVGKGLEEFVTETYSSELGRKFLTPMLKEGKYFEAYRGTVQQLMEKFGNFTDEDKARLTEKEDGGTSAWVWSILILIAILVIIVLVVSNVTRKS